VITTTKIIKRAFILLGPPLIVIYYVALTGRSSQSNVPRWAVAVIALYFVVTMALSLLSGRRQAELPAISTTDMSSLRDTTRKVWIAMIVMYVLSFCTGSIMFVLLRKTIPIQYSILGLAINLLFVWFSWRLLRNSSSTNREK